MQNIPEANKQSSEVFEAAPRLLTMHSLMSLTDAGRRRKPAWRPNSRRAGEEYVPDAISAWRSALLEAMRSGIGGCCCCCCCLRSAAGDMCDSCGA